ncbi:MAG: TnsA endonuclease N-terminal domain-containing protein [Acidobacteriaceae bacterium]
MGVTIQFESHRVELPLVYEMEHDPAVLEYYDQPPSIPLAYPTASGRRLSVMHTPDYFVLRRDSAGWVECKTEDDLEKLAIKSPHRYLRDGAGNWRCPPGEAHASALNLDYRVWSSTKVNWNLQRNLQFLDDYLRHDSGSTAGPANAAIKTIIEAEAGILLSDLLVKVHGVVESDVIYALIASGEVYVNLSKAVLAEPAHVRLFANARVAAGYGETSRELEKAVGNCGRVSGLSAEAPGGAHGEAFRLLAMASERDLAVANRRCAIVKNRLEGNTEQCLIPERTLRRWIAQYRSAESLYGNGYMGLLTKTREQGNRTSRLSEESRNLLLHFVENDYEDLRQKTKVASWAALKRKCDELGIIAPSYVTFCTAARERPTFLRTLKRQGRRASYTHSSFYFQLEPTTPRHGDRPFEIGHIDHTELDVEVVCSHTGRPLGRPWMTILIDAFSRRCLAFYLTFDAPSYRSCMMILRDCVRRNGRLPQIAVIDGGPEFQSTYFETLLARYECMKKTRPPAKARFGSVCERLFGTTNTQFIHNLRGNTQISRNIRQVTKGNSPVGQAAWTLGSLYDHLSIFLCDKYDTIEHPALGQTPREACLQALQSTGVRPNRTIPYDQAFLLATFPTSQRGTANVSPGRGIIINRVYYWAEAFRDPTVENHDVSIRYDPFDIGSAYAFVKNRWTECHSEHYTVLQGRSEKEIMLASKELRRRSLLHSRERFTLTARKLADFLESAEAEEKFLLQRLRDRESASIRQNGPVVAPCAHDSEVESKEPDSRNAMPQILVFNQAEATAVYGDF